MNVKVANPNAKNISIGKFDQTCENNSSGLNDFLYAGIKSKIPQMIFMRIANAN